jgi:putative zinc finger/helix-turn-helix YgiT family protein
MAGIVSPKQNVNGINMKTLSCPVCHNKLVLQKIKKETRFRGVPVHYEAETYICPACGLEAGTIESASAVQKAIADAYRKHKGLMAGNEIKSLRESKGWSYQYLAWILKIQPAMITRWESGLIQSRRIDQQLKQYLAGRTSG